MWQYQRKHRWLSGLSGTVLELGAGRGANFGHLGPGVEWIGLEPGRRRVARLREAADRAGYHGEILTAPAEAIPLADASCDAVIATVVLCSVRDQAKTLTEVLRVLRPGGSFVFVDHVAAPPGTWTRRLQRVAAPVSRLVDSGCDPARDTEAAIAAAGFARTELERFTEPFAFGLMIDCIAGRAEKTT